MAQNGRPSSYRIPLGKRTRSVSRFHIAKSSRIHNLVADPVRDDFTNYNDSYVVIPNHRDKTNGSNFRSDNIVKPSSDILKQINRNISNRKIDKTAKYRKSCPRARDMSTNHNGSAKISRVNSQDDRDIYYPYRQSKNLKQLDNFQENLRNEKREKADEKDNEITTLRYELMKEREETDILKDKNYKLKDDNFTLDHKNKSLKKDNHILNDNITFYKNENKQEEQLRLLAENNFEKEKTLRLLAEDKLDKAIVEKDHWQTTTIMTEEKLDKAVAEKDHWRKTTMMAFNNSKANTALIGNLIKPNASSSGASGSRDNYNDVIIGSESTDNSFFLPNDTRIEVPNLINWAAGSARLQRKSHEKGYKYIRTGMAGIAGSFLKKACFRRIEDPDALTCNTGGSTTRLGIGLSSSKSSGSRDKNSDSICSGIKKEVDGAKLIGNDQVKTRVNW